MINKFMIAGMSALCAVPVTGAIVGTVSAIVTPQPEQVIEADVVGDDVDLIAPTIGEQELTETELLMEVNTKCKVEAFQVIVKTSKKDKGRILPEDSYNLEKDTWSLGSYDWILHVDKKYLEGVKYLTLGLNEALQLEVDCGEFAPMAGDVVWAEDQTHCYWDINTFTYKIDLSEGAYHLVDKFDVNIVATAYEFGLHETTPFGTNIYRLKIPAELANGRLKLFATMFK